MTATLGLTAERCVELLDARELSCRELVAAYLDRIDAADEGIHAFLRTRRPAALEQADRFDRDGRRGLQGVPIALKDILCTKGEETTARLPDPRGLHPDLRRRVRQPGQRGGR